jgi:hypothetical protein
MSAHHGIVSNICNNQKTDADYPSQRRGSRQQTLIKWRTDIVSAPSAILLAWRLRYAARIVK